MTAPLRRADAEPLFLVLVSARTSRLAQLFVRDTRVNVRQITLGRRLTRQLRSRIQAELRLPLDTFTSFERSRDALHSCAALHVT